MFEQCKIEEEIRNGYKVTVQRKKVWLCELEILEKILEVCRDLGLKCWIDSGTLLGAIRHKGFIPWDDDIDLVMLRSDYDKLMKNGPEKFKDPFFFQSAYTDINYYRGHIQIRNSNTAAILPMNSMREFNQGIFVDIFPLDALPNDKKSIEDLTQKSIMMKTKLERYHHFNIFRNINIINNLLEQIKLEKEIDKVSFKEYYNAFENLFRKNAIDNSDYLTLLASFPTIDYAIDKHIFDETIYVPFEGILVPAPKEYDKYLRVLYGDDYMQPKMMPTLHGKVVFDTEHSYKELLPEVRRQYKRERVIGLWHKIKYKLLGNV